MRSPAGWIFPPALGLAVIALDRLGKPSHHQLAVQVLGVQACISIWRSFDYLFSSSGYVGGRSAQSDTATIADALLALLVLGRGPSASSSAHCCGGASERRSAPDRCLLPKASVAASAWQR